MADIVLPPAPRLSKGRRLTYLAVLAALILLLSSCGSEAADGSDPVGAGAEVSDSSSSTTGSSTTSTTVSTSSTTAATTTTDATTTVTTATTVATEADTSSTTSEQAVETSANQTTTKPPKPPTTVMDDGGDPLVAEVIGKTTDEAIALVRATGRKVRIAVLEGEALALTQDYDAERLNLTISGGIVKSVSLG